MSDTEESRRAARIVLSRFLKTADPDASRSGALQLMRTGYSHGDEVYKEAAANLVAVKFGLWTGGGYPDTKNVRLWVIKCLPNPRPRGVQKRGASGPVVKRAGSLQFNK